jgi:hypothetical protein
MRSVVCGVVLLAALALVPACEDDPVRDDCADCEFPLQILMPLTSREAVLNNIEYAYDNRVISAYDDLIDLNFTFFFSGGDVDGGLPLQWPRTDELGATNDLFISNSQPVPMGPRCQSIRLDLTLENLQWVEIMPEDYPEEVWYMTAVNYEFTFKMYPDDTYSSEPGAKGQFTVRNVGTETAPQWRLVEWRDLGNSLLASSRTVMSTQESTWGGVKALYR